MSLWNVYLCICKTMLHNKVRHGLGCNAFLLFVCRLPSIENEPKWINWKFKPCFYAFEQNCPFVAIKRKKEKKKKTKNSTNARQCVFNNNICIANHFAIAEFIYYQNITGTIVQPHNNQSDCFKTTTF